MKSNAYLEKARAAEKEALSMMKLEALKLGADAVYCMRIKSVFGNFSFYSYKKACGQKKTVRGSKNSRRLSNGTPAI